MEGHGTIKFEQIRARRLLARTRLGDHLRGLAKTRISPTRMNSGIAWGNSTDIGPARKLQFSPSARSIFQMSLRQYPDGLS
jgi:hypothetical protein